MHFALYRQLRPKKFSDIIGQEHIVRTLKNQIMSKKASHAYLFCGSRGTGKTSTALVFARALNCEAHIDAEACGACETCLVISRGGGFNVIEIDAASNNGVDNIRDIREEVKYPPASGRFKIYIIDEAHMLSASAFNALLKTLEEPPEGVVFILATTESQKIPPTVHSRCQRFDFKRVSSETMAAALIKPLEAQGIICAPDALMYAARAAEGSMRDILSFIDQCAAFYMNEPITLERIMEIMGATEAEALGELLSALANKDAVSCLGQLDAFIKNGKDIHQITAEFLAHMRDSLIALTAGDKAARILDMPEESADLLRRQTGGLDPKTLMAYISAFGELIPKMRYAVNPRILLEAEIVGLISSEASEAQTPKPLSSKKPKTTEKPAEEATKNIPAPTGTLASVVEEWGVFAAAFGPVERNMLISTFAECTGGNSLRIICQNSGICDILKTKRDVLNAKIKERYGLEPNLEFVLGKG